MKKYLEKITSIFDPQYFIVFSMYDAKDRYLFGIKNRKYADGEPLDPYYTIDKESLTIKGFLPHLDKEAFEYAMEHPIDF